MVKKAIAVFFLLTGFAQAALVPVPECSDRHPAIMTTARQSLFTVRLVSNATTGYRWFLKELPDLLVPISAEYVAPTRNGLVGVPGAEIWHFKVKSGSVPRQVKMMMVYARPFELGEGRQFVCQVSML